MKTAGSKCGAKTGLVRIVELMGRLVALAMLCGAASCGGSLPSPEVIAEASSANMKQFLLGPEDVLEIAVWKSEELTQKEVVVRPDGKIGVPLIGDVEASGRTADELANHIATLLKKFKDNPSVSVKVREVNSYYVYVLGDVAKPGKYQLKSQATVLQALALAGGFTLYAAKNGMQVKRSVVGQDGYAKEFTIPAQYDDLVSGRGAIKDFVLKTGDLVVVPTRAW
jgi:polysaccharide biosynthesis/export protein